MRISQARWAAFSVLVFLANAADVCADVTAVPLLDHILVVVMENKDYSQVRDFPYTASLRASGSDLTNSYAITHPSQPNYIALWAGSLLGVIDNSCPIPGTPFSAENLGQACEASGKTWRAYSENLPSAGSPVCVWDGGLYTRKHEPWTHFGNLDHQNERPYTDLAADIANGVLPQLAFVIPNNCNNTHDCSIATGDAWLEDELPAMIDAVGPNGIVILTYDEDASTPGNNNQILTVFVGPRVRPGYQSTRHVDHYDVLRTICDGLGLAPFGNAVSASPILDIWTDLVGAESPVAQSGVSLSPPAPNPSRGSITMRLRLPEAVPVELTVHDVAGRSVRRMSLGVRAGTSTLKWDGLADDGSEAGPGLYFLRVVAGTQSLVRRATLMVR